MSEPDASRERPLDADALLRASTERATRGRRGPSLRLTVLGGLIVIVLATLLGVSLSVLELVRNTAERERLRTAELLARAAARSEALDAGESLRALAASGLVDAIVFADISTAEPEYTAEGQTLTPAHERALDTIFAALAEHANAPGEPDSTPTLESEIAQGDDDGRLAVAAAPVAGRPGQAVAIVIPMRRLDQQVASAQGLVLLYLVLVGLVVLVLGYWLLTRSVVRPVHRLVRAVERVGAGDLETRIAVGGAGEVAELSQRFNAMVEAVREARDAREQTLRRLEDANAALLATNRELEQTQDSLVRSERLASVGQLSAGIAHEIGNPIASILAYLELLQDEPDMPDEEASELLERTEDATRRVHTIIRELLDYSRTDAPDLTIADPVRPVRQALRLVAPHKKLRGIAVDDALPDTLPAVPLDEGQLVQVIVNLVLNAADALAAAPPDGARPRVEITGHASDDTVVVEVADNGPGIDPDALPHIFEPFFTTKSPGEGTGLGLAMAERLLAQMGASIDVSTHTDDDEQPRGTTFTVRIPRDPSEREDDVHTDDAEDTE